MKKIMKAIAMQDINGAYVPLLLGNLDNDCILEESRLKRLYPYVARFADADPSLETAWGKLKVVVLSDTKAAFAIDGAEGDIASGLLNNIRETCNTLFSEKLIVPQFMGYGPIIRHRVMQFEVNKDKMFVKYITLGDFNNFDAAMFEVAAMYPEMIG